MRKTLGSLIMRKGLGSLIVLVLLVTSVTGCRPDRGVAQTPLPDPWYVQMADVQNGWVVAGGMPGTGIVARTADGGLTWTNAGPKALRDPYAALQTFTFKDAQTAWLVVTRSRQPAEVWRTADGGQTWFSGTVDTGSKMPGQIFALDDETAWLLAGTGTGAGLVDLYRTGDGGASWAKVLGADTTGRTASGLPPLNINGVSFVDASTGWLTGTSLAPGSSSMVFYVTHDGGRSWSPQRLELPDDLKPYGLTITPPTFIDGHQGFLTIGGSNMVYLYSTQDAGASWNAVGWFAGVLPPLVSVVDGDYIYCAARSALEATSDGGHHWTAVYSRPNANAFRSLSFPDPQNGWAVMGFPNDPPRLFRTTDGGAHWESVQAVLKQPN